MSDQNTPENELNDDQLEEAAGGCWSGDPGDGGIIGGGCVIYPEPFPMPEPKPYPYPGDPINPTF